MIKVIAHSLVENNGKVLLMKRSQFLENGKKRHQGGKWDFPGGMVEDREYPHEAAIRETREEAKLDIEIERILYETSNYDESKACMFVTLVYLARTSQTKVILNIEHTDFQWLNIEDILTSPLEFVDYVQDTIQTYLLTIKNK